MWRRTSALIVAGFVGLSVCALAACGSPADTADGVASLADASASGTATPTPTSTMSEEDRVFAFAACMREHGVDMPDPVIDEDGGIQVRIGSKGSKIDPKKVETAQKACSEFAPFGGKPPKLSQEQLEKLQKMAQCMRDHGVDVPDPSDTGLIEVHSGASRKGTDASGVNPEDPKVKKAMAACQQYLPKLQLDEKGDS